MIICQLFLKLSKKIICIKTGCINFDRGKEKGEIVAVLVIFF